MRVDIRSPKLKKDLIAAALLLLLAAATVFAMNGAVVSAARDSIVTSVREAPNMPVVIVLGARVHDDGTLFPTTQDRVDTAVDLYKAGKVAKLLITGDHGRAAYDEVNNMRRHAEKRGVPSEDIFMDHAGFDTFDSMYRARNIFGVRRALVVTQRFHLARAIYTAGHVGITAVGVPADKRAYMKAPLFEMREALSRAKAFAELKWSRPRPAQLGAKIDIHGDGRVTMDQGQ